MAARHHYAAHENSCRMAACYLCSCCQVKMSFHTFFVHSSQELAVKNIICGLHSIQTVVPKHVLCEINRH